MCAVPTGTAVSRVRPRLELAEIVRADGDAYRRTHRFVKILTLETDEFLRRFLLHIVPRGFMRIRHFGLLANRTRCRRRRRRSMLTVGESHSVLLLRGTRAFPCARAYPLVGSRGEG